MRQQINLYQPIFRPHHRPFSAATALWVVVLVTGSLLAIWGYGLLRVNRLSQDLARLHLLQQQQLQMAANGGAAQARRQSPAALQAQATQLLADLKQRQQALQLLHSGAAGDTGGFAGRLEALARRHVDGLWLDQIVLIGGAGVASLSGRTLDPELVPAYLRGLRSESALAGTRFEQFRIESAPSLAGDGEAAADAAPSKPAKAPLVRFQAQTAAAIPAPAKGSS